MMVDSILSFLIVIIMKCFFRLVPAADFTKVWALAIVNPEGKDTWQLCMTVCAVFIQRNRITVVEPKQMISI